MILPTSRFVVQFLTRIVEDDKGCWLWTGFIEKTGGYPRWYAGDPREQWAHRNAYKMAGGTIPDGWHVDHLRFVRSCVNPNHLEAVTPEENTRRAMARMELSLPGLHLPPAVAMRATWDEMRRSQAERVENIASAVKRLRLYDNALELLRPVMEANPDLTVEAALRRLRRKS